MIGILFDTRYHHEPLRMPVYQPQNNNSDSHTRTSVPADPDTLQTTEHHKLSSSPCIKMPILEFVHLHLPTPNTTTTATLLSTIPSSCAMMFASSGLPSIFLSDLLDDTKMYVIGGWPSQDAHQKVFNGSKEQGELIEGIKGIMGIEWMEYVDMEVGRLRGEMGKGCLVGVVVGFGDLGDAGKWREEVEGRVKGILGEVVMAWNLKKKEKEGEGDYLIAFTGFEGLEDGKAWGEVVRGELEGVEGVKSVKVVYGKRIDVEGNGNL